MIPWSTVPALLLEKEAQKIPYHLAQRQVLAGVGARVVEPGSFAPLDLLRADQPPLDCADAWWNVLHGRPEWTPKTREILRECRFAYAEELGCSGSIPAAVEAVEGKWDRLHAAMFPQRWEASTLEPAEDASATRIESVPAAPVIALGVDLSHSSEASVLSDKEAVLQRLVKGMPF